MPSGDHLKRIRSAVRLLHRGSHGFKRVRCCLQKDLIVVDEKHLN